MKSLIELELLSARNKTMHENAILETVARILKENEKQRGAIREKIAAGNLADENAFKTDLLEADKIFHLSQIRQICIDYRLRFLDSKMFKNGIPEEAITKINALEKLHHTDLSGFKIMAPGKAFELLSYDDPFLFAPIGNDYFYLVHQWGNEITAKRKWLVAPFRNLMSFTLLCIIISLLVTVLTPENKLSRSVPMADIIIFLFAFKSIIAVFMYAFFMLGKNFNSAIWDRPFFNN